MIYDAFHPKVIEFVEASDDFYPESLYKILVGDTVINMDMNQTELSIDISIVDLYTKLPKFELAAIPHKDWYYIQKTVDRAVEKFLLLRNSSRNK